MRIRKLELHGFKSFPDRTSLVFGEGISCIVGPNGCGKSNIVDALRWCIGEQSARSLRGADMSDVIFAGSQDRKPVGFAEVSITLTSEGGEPFPGEYAQLTEVSVGRRLHRSGASEYFVNQRRVRRRDVQDLFLDTGIGNNLYSFIEQGRIGKIVHAKPEERRSLIDEAAGISRYKQRRDEARERLVATAAQLDRAADVADEMSRRVRTLAKQVLKAGKFRRLRAEVKQDEIALSLARFIALTADRKVLRARFRTAEGDLEAARRGLARREVDLTERRSEIDVVQEEVDRHRDHVAELDARIREIDGLRGFTEQRLQELVAREEREREARDSAMLVEHEAAEAYEAAMHATATAKLRHGELAASLGEVEASDRAARDRLLALRAQERERSTAAVHLAQERARLQQQLEDLRARVAELPGMERSLEEESLRARDARVLAEEAANAAQDRWERAQRDVEQERAIVAASEAAFVEASGAVDDARTALEGAERALQVLKAEHVAALSAAQTRVRRLEDERRALEATLTAAQEAAANTARVEGQQTLARITEEGAQRIEAARRRADAWLTALSGQLSDQERQTRDQVARRLLDLDERYRGALVEIDEARKQLVEGAQASVRAKWAEEKRLRESTLSDRVAHRDAIRQQLSANKGSLLTTERECGEAEIRWERAVLEVRALEEREVGAAAVRTALPETGRFLDRVVAPLREQPWFTKVFADWMSRPVLPLDDVARAAEVARHHGTTQFLIRDPALMGEAEVMGGVALVDSMEDAVALFREAPRGVVVKATGDRIESDGRVIIRGAVTEERTLADVEAHLARCATQLDELRGRCDDLRTAIATSEAALDKALVEVADAEEALRAAEQNEVDDLRAAVEGERERHEERARALAAEVETDRERAREEGGASIAEAARWAAQQLEATQRQRDEALLVCTAAVDAERDRARRRLEDLEATARDAARERVQTRMSEVLAEEMAAREVVRQREDESPATLTAASGPVDEARARLEESRSRLEEARARRDDALRQQSELSLFAARSETTALSAKQTLERAEAEVVRLAEALAQVRATGAGLVSAIEDAEKQFTATITDLERADAELAGASTALEEAEGAASAASERAAQTKVEVATWLERVTAAEQAVGAAEARRDAARLRIEEANRVLTELAEQRTTTSSSNVETESERESTLAERAEAWDRLESERARLHGLRDALAEAEADLRQRVADVGEQTRSTEQLRAEVDAARSEMEALQQRMEERYQIRLAGQVDLLEAQGRLVLAPDPLAAESLEVDGTVLDPVEPVVLNLRSLSDEAHIQRWMERLEQGRAALERMGDVNLAAYDEYREVHTRHSDLEVQRADLEASVEQIRAAIAKMNRTCRQRFRDTFDLVNEHFQELYPKLVGGGSARLSLTDDEDLLETGVDIFVQPPGKRLQNLSLLSGGEKAMTAIALILSLFRVKPSPFCVLDEVDAPLDEANGSRFNQALVEMCSVSQFIVISHNRRTMEVASTLYGITMPDPGVSRLVTVQLGG